MINQQTVEIVRIVLTATLAILEVLSKKAIKA